MEKPQGELLNRIPVCRFWDNIDSCFVLTTLFQLLRLSDVE